MTRTLVAIPRYIIEGALGEAEYEEIRESYSGRGMYGDSCFGVVLPTQRDINIFIFGLGYEGRDLEDSENPVYAQLADDLHRMARASKVDSMGSSVIVYFPGFTLGDRL